MLIFLTLCKTDFLCLRLAAFAHALRAACVFLHDAYSITGAKVSLRYFPYITYMLQSCYI